MKKITILLLGITVIISLFFNLYKKDVSPPGFNADEAAFGYNAYAILKTGRDEYGAFLPLRLKSFGDYKLPLYSYLSIPFIAVFGLDAYSSRFLNTFLAALVPIAFFFLAKELFKDTRVSLLAAFFGSTTLGLHLIGRQAHEAYLALFLLSLTVLFFVRMMKKRTLTNSMVFSLLVLLSLFSYQSSRIAIGVLFLYALFAFITKKRKRYVPVLIIALLVVFSFSDFLYKPERVKNLLFLNNVGFALTINELRAEGGNKLFYNKALIGVRDILYEHFRYFSPEYFMLEGDKNLRFGFPKMSIITPLTYVFFFIGLYFLFRKKQEWRYLLLTMLFLVPLAGSLSWAGTSLTRSLFLLVPILLISSFGLVQIVNAINKKHVVIVSIGILLFLEVSFLYYSWDFYLNHYPKRAVVQRSWQGGYTSLTEYIKQNYNNFDTFYITKKNGQPYIFLLFDLQYPPHKYQQQAKLSSPDEYGFGQVEQFDKFTFSFKIPPDEKRIVAIGYPDDFQSLPPGQVNMEKIKKVTVGSEEIFWIYEQ